MLPSTVSFTTLTAGTVKATNLQDANSNTAMSVSKMTTNAARYTRQIICLSDTTDRSATTSWVAGTTFTEMTGFKGGSVLKIYYMYPCRNDSTGWGGLYFEPQIQFNTGTWYSLGSRGYDAVMHNTSADIHWTENTMYVDPSAYTGTSDFSMNLRFYFRSYDGTVGLNNSQGHDLNATSGTASNIGGGYNIYQHYGHWIIEELALFRGNT